MYKEIPANTPPETEILRRMLKYPVLSEEVQDKIRDEIEQIEIRFRKQQRGKYNA